MRGVGVHVGPITCGQLACACSIQRSKGRLKPMLLLHTLAPCQSEAVAAAREQAQAEAQQTTDELQAELQQLQVRAAQVSMLASQLACSPSFRGEACRIQDILRGRTWGMGQGLCTVRICQTACRAACGAACGTG
jgi:hypothetical protein